MTGDAPQVPRVTPATIHVALRDGFIGEHIVVRLDGVEVFASKEVRTRFQIGLAEEFELEAPSRPCELEFTMPMRDLTETVAIEDGEERWIGASMGDDETLVITVSDRPFRYA